MLRAVRRCDACRETVDSAVHVVDHGTGTASASDPVVLRWLCLKCYRRFFAGQPTTEWCHGA